jgi:alanine racemase
MTQPLLPALVPPRPVPADVAVLRPTVVEVDTSALAHNLREVRRLVGDEVRVLAVVKADAYGHGAVPCARAFVEAGADWLGVALVEEGVELRRAGLLTPICVLSGMAGLDDAKVLVAHRLTPLIYRPDHLAAMGAAVRSAGLSRYAVHLKVDTGMGRWGALPEDVDAFLTALRRHPELELEGLATHFAGADDEDGASVGRQSSLFRELESLLRTKGFEVKLRHLSNSAAVLSHPAAHFDMVRPGLMLYGHSPVAGVTNLRPALTLRTRIAHVRDVPAGFSVSYGGTFVTAHPSRLATLPIGYADGLPRRASHKARMLVRGRHAPVVGRICMDACVLDVTAVPGASLGDEVVIIGEQQGATVGADELAAHADTIAYEILTGLGKRVPRTYR